MLSVLKNHRKQRPLYIRLKQLLRFQNIIKPRKKLKLRIKPGLNTGYI